MTFTTDFAHLWLSARIALLHRAKSLFELKLNFEATKEDLLLLYSHRALTLDDYTHSLTLVITAQAVREAELTSLSTTEHSLVI